MEKVKYKELLDLAKRYDRSIEGLEDTAINRINKIYEQSFQQLIKKVKLTVYEGKIESSLLTRDLFITQQLNELLSLFSSNRQDVLDNLYKLIDTVSEQSNSYAIRAVDIPFSGVPVEAIAYQANESYERLKRHGKAFAEDVTNIVGQGISQGWGERQITIALTSRLGILKGRAEDIARTETIKAFSNVSQERFKSAGVDGIIWLTVKEGVCKYCSWRNGKVFKIGSFIHPPHPRCRCVLLPRVGEDDEEEFLKYYKPFKGENPGVAPFEKTAGFTKVTAIKDLMKYENN